VASRQIEKSKHVCQSIVQRVPSADLVAVQTPTASETADALQGAQIVIAAGAAGIELCSREICAGTPSLRIAIDLNAVPPAGIAGVEVMDKGQDRGGVICYGAIGVGGTKMKIHKAALQRLFTANNLVLDAEEVFAIGQELAK
jgi:hypothetical protein